MVLDAVGQFCKQIMHLNRVLILPIGSECLKQVLPDSTFSCLCGFDRFLLVFNSIQAS